MRHSKFWLLALIPMVLSSCEESGSPDGPVPTQEYYFMGDVNGTSILIEIGVNDYRYRTGLPGINTSCYKEFRGAITHYHSQGIDSNSIDINLLKHLPASCDSPGTKFHEIFIPNAYQYFNRYDSAFGVAVFWSDENGKFWSSYYGNQDSSVFTIIESDSVSPCYDSTGVAINKFKIKATFNCTLYDLYGNNISLNNGEISIFFTDDSQRYIDNDCNN